MTMMLRNTAAANPLRLSLPSGVLAAHRSGGPSGALAIAIPGLSANSRSFDALGAAVGSPSRALVALDLRGRGWSDITPPGTYGWKRHARDVLDAASFLGAERFDVVGHSMGAYVAMAVARMAPERVSRVVLIDAIGAPEPAALPPIVAAVRRLGGVHADADAYVRKVRALGVVDPWCAQWDAHYRYDLIAAPGGVRPRTDAGAVLEDFTYSTTQAPWTWWPSLAMRALLVRASRPLGGGFIVSKGDRDRFALAAPRASVLDVDANHYGVLTHPTTLEGVARFLS